MAQVKFKDKVYTVASGASLLDTLLEHGHDIPNSCRAGLCQSCMVQVTEGEAPEHAQKGLKDSYRAKGLILACSCHPQQDLAISLPDSEQLRVPAKVAKIKTLANDVVELQLETEAPFEYLAGQFVTLWRNDKLGRSYSLVSLPGDNNLLSFHIKKIDQGEFSNWIHDELKVGDTLSVQGPAGDCFYIPGQPGQDILLIGTGTGLAPLLGIVHDALQHGHTGQLQLMHGALNASGLYFHEQLRALAEKYDNVTYHPCVLNAEEGMAAEIRQGSIDAMVKEAVPEPAGWKAYLCGDPALVTKLRKQLFLAGCNMNDIYADAFFSSRPADKTD